MSSSFKDKMRQAANAFAPLLSPISKQILEVRYWSRFKRRLNLKNPTLFFDKIYWLSLNTDTSLWTVLADKYAVREYVEKVVGKEVLNDLYGVYNAPEEIDYRQLPQSFVLKTNNACATNIIVHSKEELDEREANKQLGKWLNFHYGEVTGELHYTRIPPKIIAEKLLVQNSGIESSLVDYKIYCFSGEPVYILTTSDRVFETHAYSRMMYDVDWNPHPDFFNKEALLREIERPESLDLMLDSAAKLSQSIPFVRIDFYEINQKPVFGEMTFMPGMADNYTYEFQKELGDLITISQDNEKG